MRILDDREKDLFIKNELQKDDLISKKADDVFNDFFKGEINLEEKEKVVEINQKKKQPIPFGKRVLSMVASLVIVFLAANAYAATKGYNNIFFAIKKMFAEEESKVVTKDEILTDKDITISFQDIEIADGLKVQINSLIIENNNAKLYLTITEKENTVIPKKYTVKDKTNGGINLASQMTSRKEMVYPGPYQEIIELKGIKENTNILSLEIFDNDDNSIALMEIDLEKKEINVLTGKSKGEVQKLSETELKEALGDFVGLALDDEIKDKANILKFRKLWLATHLIDEKEHYKDVIYTKEKMIKVYKEFAGETITDPKDVLEKDSFLYYDEKKERYDYSVDGLDGYVPAKVLAIKDLNYKDGIYTADVVYITPSEGDSLDNNFENLDQYEVEIKFKLNSDYEYTRYQIVNINSLEKKIYSKKETATVNENSNTVANVIENKNDNTADNISEKSSTIRISKRADLIDGMSFKIDRLEFKDNNKAVLYVNIIETEKVPQNKRIKSVDVSYESPLLGGTSVGNTISSTSNEFSTEFRLHEIANDVTSLNLSLKCDKGLIANLVVDLVNKDLNVTYFNDSLNQSDEIKVEQDLKDTIARYILMNYYKDIDGNNSQENKNEMMLYTAFLLDEDGMYRNFGMDSKYTNIGESIVYSIIKGYTGISFDENTKTAKTIMTREENSAGMEASIKYISGTRYNLVANIKDIESISKEGDMYTIAFTYSYNLKPNNTFRATMKLRNYEYDSSNPIAKSYVLYQLVDTNIQSEKVN